MDFLPPDGKSPTEGSRVVPEAFSEAECWLLQERDAERAYLGTLMGWNPGCPKVVTGVEYPHFSADIRADILHVLRDLHPWEDCLKLGGMVTATLTTRYGHNAAAMEYAECLAMQEPWRELADLGKAVVEGWKRRERLRLLDGARLSCHDSEAIAEVCKQLAALG